jgi:hypothetical protein
MDGEGAEGEGEGEGKAEVDSSFVVRGSATRRVHGQTSVRRSVLLDAAED